MGKSYFSDIDFDFARHPTSKYAIAGQPTTLPCSPPISYPPANVTWCKNNQPLTNQFSNGSQTVFIVDPANGIWDLFIADVQRIHEGQYFCVAENVFAVPTSRTSKVATLRVGGRSNTCKLLLNCKLFTFSSSSQEPQGHFQPNLAQSILG